MAASARTRVIACGAIARELVSIARRNGWEHLEIEALPPELHNRPERIPGAVRRRLEQARADGRRSFVAYADCGTGGRLDVVLEQFGARRLPGAHCYEFLAGAEAFERLAADEPGTFYLTDFLVRNFDRLVWRGLGLDRHPELRDAYFGNYHRVLYLAQQADEELERQARDHAARLGLPCRIEHTGPGPLQRSLHPLLPEVSWRN